MLRIVIKYWTELCLSAAIGFSAIAGAQTLKGCGDLENAYGPYDYTNPVHFSEKLPVVEQHHFDAGIAQLKGHLKNPNGRVNIPLDLDYTLRAFPNHHRALYTMSRYYVERVQTGNGNPMPYTADCYFDRARRWAPNDSTVLMIQAIYFHTSDRLEAALDLYEKALVISPDSAELHYNTGLLYADLRNYDSALEHAHRAYQLGYPLPGLRNVLTTAGVWKDPPTPDQ